MRAVQRFVPPVLVGLGVVAVLALAAHPVQATNLTTGPGRTGSGSGTASAGTVGSASGRAAPSVRAVTTDRRSVRDRGLYVSPDTPAAKALAGTRSGSPDAALLAKIARQAQTLWLGDQNPTATVRSTVARLVTKADGAVLPLALYDIPLRDCSHYSGGGARSPQAYRDWVDQVAAGLRGASAVVVLEPDALAMLDCLPADQQQVRLDLLRYAVDALTANPAVAVYLDAGSSNWGKVPVLATRLRAAGIDHAQGFALNVSNFKTLAAQLAWGRKISAAIGGAHFVVDTSRNGRGAWTGTQEWCNPPGRALGPPPSTATNDPLLDATLWVKTVGVSDGTCRAGAPKAGTFWRSYALELARNASW